MRFRDGIPIPRIRETGQPFADNTLQRLSRTSSRLAHGGIICQFRKSVRGICLTTNRRRWKRRRKRGVNESCQAYARLWPPWSALRAAHRVARTHRAHTCGRTHTRGVPPPTRPCFVRGIFTLCAVAKKHVHTLRRVRSTRSKAPIKHRK